MKYHIWDPETDEFEAIDGHPYHQIESNLGALRVAERWVEERLDPDGGYVSLDGDGVVVMVRDEQGNEERFRVTGMRTINYTATREG